MTNTEYFSDSYIDARDKFLSAAKSCNAHVTSPTCPQKGPSKEDLFVDVARVGDLNAKRILVVVSGTHGVEGFCGSACQAAWLRSSSHQITSDTAVYFLHGLNPYGFAWRRRVNEDNVDLNRNFLELYSGPLIVNAEYRELEALLNPRLLSEKSMGNLDPALEEWFASPQKVKAFKAAVGKGQYEFPKGILFGGKSPTWSNRVLRDFIRSLPAPLEIGVVLDIHTGLGEMGQLEIFTEESGSKFDTLKQWFELKKVTTLGGIESLGYTIMGSLYQAFTKANSNSPWHCVALEYGTQPLVQVLLALQADNWLYCFAPEQHSLSTRVRQQMTDAFLIPSDAWKNQVVTSTLDVITMTLAGMTRFSTNEVAPNATN
jgi:hypothetical protein